MRFFRAKTVHWLLAAACLAAFVVGGHFAAKRLIGQQQAQQIRELAAIALRRAEATVDASVTALEDLTREGEVGCDPASMQRVKLHVYQRGFIKDVRVVSADASIQCSAYSETLEFDQGWITREAMLPAADPTVRLFRVDQFFGTALGLMKDSPAGQGLVAVLGIDGSMLDILPGELAGQSEVALRLRDGPLLARNGPELTAETLQTGLSLAIASKRFPLIAVVSVPAAALTTWHGEPYAYIMVLYASLGAVLAALVLRMNTRPPSPTDAMDAGIAAREFQPFLQPIFDLETRTVRGAEILVRWVKADGTVLPPSRFLDLAESSGRMDTITWHLLRTALAEMQPLMKLDKGFRLSLNVAPRHFVSPAFPAQLRQIVAEAGVATRQITLEVTEREAFENLDRAAEVVSALRGFGFRVAIDDVGIGHSGLSQIQRLGADTIKIDKFFVDGIERDASAASIVGMLVRLARDMKMGVVAEGIETEGQAAALLACGVAFGQGYIASPPLAVEAFKRFVREHGGGRAAPDQDAVAAA